MQERVIDAFETENLYKKKIEKGFDMEDELNHAHREFNISLNLRTRFENEMKDLAGAKYCENETDELRLFGNIV